MIRITLQQLWKKSSEEISSETQQTLRHERILDLNRAQFGEVSFEKGLRGFIRLAHDEFTVELISKTYAKLAGRSAQEALTIFSQAVDQHKTRMANKKKLKELLGFGK